MYIYTANYKGKGTKGQYVASRAYPTREEAAKELFMLFPSAKEVATGYGYSGSFAIRWIKRYQVE